MRFMADLLLYKVKKFVQFIFQHMEYAGLLLYLIGNI